MTIDTLTTRGVGINHVSVVTSVNRMNGELVSYEMFHGRRPGKPASITKSEKTYSYDSTLPMYGNHRETWLGIVPVMMVNEGTAAVAQ